MIFLRTILLLFSFLWVSLNSMELTQSEFPWSIGFCLFADVHPQIIQKTPEMESIECRILYDPEYYLDHIKDGSIVWVQAERLLQFEKDVLSKLDCNIILVAGSSDYTFPYDYPDEGKKILSHLKSGKIIHLFIQNSALQKDNITCIPIGLDFHTPTGWPDRIGSRHPLTVENQTQQLKNLISKLKSTKWRKKWMYCDFALNDTMQSGFAKRYKEFGINRTGIRNLLSRYSFYQETTTRLPRFSLWNHKANCSFDISPPGNGLDCHRTWESLLLGCIVIVQDSPINKVYEGLPVIPVSCWDEVTPRNLRRWLRQYGNVVKRPDVREKLTFKYWTDKIHSAQNAYRKESQ